jgi:hypothetical protein
MLGGADHRSVQPIREPTPGSCLSFDRPSVDVAQASVDACAMKQRYLNWSYRQRFLFMFSVSVVTVIVARFLAH